MEDVRRHVLCRRRGRGQPRRLRRRAIFGSHYRTQNYSRIWCSILIALVLAFAARRWPRGRWFAATIAAAFVGFGVAGGMERQEFFVATWSHQRKELVSLVRQAAVLAPQSVLVLAQPPTPSILLATEAE